jgi:hypothetical protein
MNFRRNYCGSVDGILPVLKGFNSGGKTGYFSTFNRSLRNNDQDENYLVLKAKVLKEYLEINKRIKLQVINPHQSHHKKRKKTRKRSLVRNS